MGTPRLWVCLWFWFPADRRSNVSEIPFSSTIFNYLEIDNRINSGSSVRLFILFPFFPLPGRKKFQRIDHFTILTRPRSKRQQDRAVPVAAAWYSRPNNNLLRVRCGIRNVSIAPSVIVLSTLCWPATDRTKRSIAVPVTANYSDPKDLASGIHPLLFQPMAITLLPSKFHLINIECKDNRINF